MKPTKRDWGWPSAPALAGLVWLSVLAAARGVTVELQIKVFIDGQDQLVIGGDSLQWHHLGNVVPGRWEQAVEQPTIISSAFDDVPQMSEVAWIPEWPEPFPEPIEHPAWSSVFTGWRPGLPAADMTVTLIPHSVRWSASVVQSPAAGNAYQTIVWFDDGPPAGAAWYEVAIQFRIPPPELVTQPADQSVVAGATAGMEVTARGAVPLGYQWFKDGSALVEGARVSGVNTARLSVANVLASDAGWYHVVVTNQFGSAASRKVELWVTGGGAADPHTLLYLSFDDTLEGAEGERPLFSGGVSFVPGVKGSGVSLPRAGNLVYDSAGQIATSQGTVEFWVEPAWRGGDNATHYFLNWGTDGGAVFSKDGANNLRFYFNQWHTEVGAFLGVSGWASNVWHHVAYTWSSSPTASSRSQCKIYVDGKLQASTTSSTLISEPVADPQRLQVGGDLSDSAHALEGVLDELRISDVEQSAAEIGRAYNDGLAHLVPRLVSPPKSRTNEVGATATFAVLANGSEPLSYLWRKDNTPLADDGRVSGATNRTLTIGDCRLSDAGAYVVAIQNRYGQAASAPAVLTVLSSPVLHVTNLVWVETLAGSGVAGYADGSGTQAQFNHPNAGAVDAARFVYIADTYGHRIRKISPTGEVRNLAGTGVAGYADGPGASAQFNQPLGLCVETGGTVYVVEAVNHCLRKITADGMVSTQAGDRTPGFRDGPGAQAQFDFPNDVAVDGAGHLYVTEFDNHTVRRVTPEGVVSTWVGDRTAGYRDGPRAQARLTQPGGIACDDAGNLYVTEWGGQRVRKVSVDGMVSTVAGTGEAGYQDGPAGEALFNQPDGIVVDGVGNLWLTDNGNHVIRRITMAGVVETVAGTGAARYVDGEGTRAQFHSPAGIGFAGAETFYVADWGNHVVRRVFLPRPVEIVAQPESRQVWLAEDVTFRVTAEGTPPLGYVWFKDGVALSEGLRVEGVNTPELRLRLAQPEDAGSYWVVVANRAGTRSSGSAALVVLEPAPGQAEWVFSAEGILTGCPAIGWDGTLYATYRVEGQNAGGLHALNGRDGKLLWNFKHAGQVRDSPAVGPDGTVYLGAISGWLHAVDGATGMEKWGISMPGGIPSSPAVAADGTVVANFGSTLCAVEAGGGRKLWEFQTKLDDGYGCSAPLISSDGSVFVASFLGDLYALDGVSGTPRWHLPMQPTGAFSPPALGPDGVVYVGTVSGRVYAVHGFTGAVKWQQDFGPYNPSPLVGADGILYVETQGPPAVLYALEATTGQARWTAELGDEGVGCPALGGDGTLYVAAGGRLYALDSGTGACLGKFAMDAGVAYNNHPTIGEVGLVYIAAGKKMHAFRDLGHARGHPGLAYAPWPKYRGDAQNSGRYTCRAEHAAILYQPKRRVLSEAEPGRLEVRLRPNASLALQWFHDGVPVPGGTNAVLTFEEVSRNHGGLYELSATNAQCQVRSETIVAIASNVKPLRFPGWRWEGGGGAVTVEASPSIFGPWTDLFSPLAGATAGHYVETNLVASSLHYRFREESGETTARFTAAALVPGWWYETGVGSKHRIEYVWSGSGWTNWVLLTELTLPASPHLFLDTDAFDHPGAVYRTTPVP